MANYTNNDEAQSGDISVDVLQSQFQGIFLKGSSDISITQAEAQALVVLQVALQAALDVLLIVFDLDDDDDDVKELQSLTQSIKAAQFEKQTIVIKDSHDIGITQEQAQIDVLIQLAVQLLARIEAKLLEI